MQNSLHSLTCKIMPEEKEIEGRLREIAVKWKESPYARKTNCAVQVKHVLGGLSRIQGGRINHEV